MLCLGLHARRHAGVLQGHSEMPTRAAILGYASLWYALLENRKRYELRRGRVEVPPGGLRVLLVCSKAVRERECLSRKMAVGICYNRLGPFTADYIISRPDLLGQLFASPDEIRRLLPLTKRCSPTVGYLYELEGVKRSKTVTWAKWAGNGSNQFGLMEKHDKQKNKDRWDE